MPAKRMSDNLRYEIDKNTGCWNYTMGLNAYGYGQYSLSHDKNISAHRYFFEKYKGKIKEGLILDHLCRNKKCVNPNHLEVVSLAENTRRGLSAKLDKRKVGMIKVAYKFGKKTQKQIAKLFNINQSQVSRIVNGLRWTN